MPVAAPVAHRIIRDDHGRPVVVKRCTDPVGRARLAHEHATLIRVAGPAVVPVVGFTDDEGAVELHLAWTGSHSLATVAAHDPRFAGHVVAAVADAVAALHRAGFAHGRLTPDHVLLAEGWQPVLTGLADARPVDPDLAADDVAALGALLVTLLAGGDEPLVIDARAARSRTAGLRGALLTLADHAQAAEPLTRPTVEGLATAIRDTLPRDHRAVDDRLRSRPDHHRPSVLRIGLGVGLGIAVAGTVAAATWLVPDDAPDQATLPTTTAPSPSSTTPGPATTPDPPTPTTVAEPAPAPAPSAPTPADPAEPTCGAGVDGPDVDGDGCADEVRVEGERVTVGTTTWVVGRPGDHVAVADWDCDGTATAAALRPTSGEVFVFDRWVPPGDEVTVTPAATVDGATAIEAVADADGCADLVVVRDGGQRVRVEVPA